VKIVILDGYTENPGDLNWDPIKEFGELMVYDRTSLTDTQEIVSRIGEAEIVITNKTPITRETIAQCPGMRYIGVLATGYNIVDTEAAKEGGIPVTNIPTYGTEAVGQFAIVLLLEICHHIGDHNRAVHGGRWENSGAASSVGINPKKVQYTAMLLCGILCGLGGAYMSMGYLSWFTKNMVAGRGFIALAAQAMGGGSTVVTMFASMLFGAADSLANSMQIFKIPTEFVQMIPYVITIFSLAFYSYKKMKHKTIEKRNG
jgi:ribose/xylose/arabinose/galactoside ABC-type transport system permease subunit